jgi:dsDNA-specific endonuclease/ATPase MutS2
MLDQARDARFVNASVEFNMETLAPTYRLMWGVAGASNALAVARGLGFDPLVIDEAERVAQDARFANAGTGQVWTYSRHLCNDFHHGLFYIIRHGLIYNLVNLCV